MERSQNEIKTFQVSVHHLPKKTEGSGVLSAFSSIERRKVRQAAGLSIARGLHGGNSISLFMFTGKRQEAVAKTTRKELRQHS